MSQSYSLHTKTIDVIDKHNMKHYTPGPGSYEPVDFENGSGRYGCSKYSDSKLGTIDPTLERFPKVKQTPGPSTYNSGDGELGSGHYTLSRHAGKGGRVFGREGRFTCDHWRSSKNPGPANYDVPT